MTQNTPKYFTTKQLLGATFLAGPLAGCLFIALNSKIRNPASKFYLNMISSLIVTLGFFAVIYHIDGQSPSWYWPFVMAFSIAIFGEFVHGDFIEEQITEGKAIEHPVYYVLRVALIGLAGEFVILLLGVSLLANN